MTHELWVIESYARLRETETLVYVGTLEGCYATIRAWRRHGNPLHYFDIRRHHER